MPLIEEDSSLGKAAAVGSRVLCNIAGKRELADIRLQKRGIALHIAAAVLVLHLLCCREQRRCQIHRIQYGQFVVGEGHVETIAIYEVPRAR